MDTGDTAGPALTAVPAHEASALCHSGSSGDDQLVHCYHFYTASRDELEISPLLFLKMQREI